MNDPVVGPTADKVILAIYRLSDQGAATDVRSVSIFVPAGENATRQALARLRVKEIINWYYEGPEAIGKDGTVLTQWKLTPEGERIARKIRYRWENAYQGVGSPK